jgi:hypothetical protein
MPPRKSSRANAKKAEADSTQGNDEGTSPERLRALESEVVRLVMQNAGLVKKDVLLQDEFERLRALNEPGLLQLKQLIVEPAVNREFMRLASLAKTSSLEAHRLKDEVRGLHFASNNPKGPSSLLSQIKGLEAKVKALSAESTESRASSLEASLKLAEARISDLGKKVYVLEKRNQELLADKDALEKELLGFRHPRDGGRGGVPAKRGRRGRYM